MRIRVRKQLNIDLCDFLHLFVSRSVFFIVSIGSNEIEVRKNEPGLSDFGELSLESEDQDVLPEIEDESSLDGELGKRLNQMVPIPVSAYEI